MVLTTSAFKESGAYQQLEQLAKEAPDLRQELKVEQKDQRLSKWVAKSCQWSLYFGMQRINEPILEALEQLANDRQVLAAMQGMQRGAPVNFVGNSTPKPALHTSLRDFFGEAKTPKETALASKELERVWEFLEHEGARFTHLIFLGIGGSELGPKVLFQALEAFADKRKTVHFVSNVDPDEVAAVASEVSLEKSLVVCVSKSGTTLESATNCKFLMQLFRDKGLNPAKHFVSVTCPGTAWDDPSFLKVFYIWDYIGGRFSTLSVSGALLIGFACGPELFMDVLAGAYEMDGAALEEDLFKNLPLLMALIGVWNRQFLKLNSLCILPYSRALSKLAAHLQQVDMESNGKQVLQTGKGLSFPTGPLVWGEAGTNAQHSICQWLHQGTDTVPIDFIAFKSSQRGQDYYEGGSSSQQKLLANCFAQALSLARGRENQELNLNFPGNRPSQILLAKQLNAKSFGSLFALYEHKVAFQGFLWGINSFDQEGVQLGKHLAEGYLSALGATEASDDPFLQLLKKMPAK